MRSDSAVHTQIELQEVTRRLRGAIEPAARKAATLRRPILAWAAARISSLDPMTAFVRSSSFDRMFWGRADEKFGLVGIDRTLEFTFHGAGRFEDAAAAWRACVEDAVGEGPDADTAAGLLALGGFAFASGGPVAAEWRGFPPAAITVPRLCICATGDECRLIVTVMVRPDGRAEIDAAIGELQILTKHIERPEMQPAVQAGTGAVALVEFPSQEQWKNSVARSSQAVRDGVLRKVVLARALRVSGVRVSAAAALARLRVEYPTCAIFAVSRGDGCFLGATPERLVRIHKGQVTTMAVAGSAPRGGSPDDDRRLGQELLKSPKDRLEHAVVVDVLRDVISETCDDVTIAPAPTLLKLPNIQHLMTPLAGRLREELSVVEVAGRLHPTPAMGGFPRESALKWLGEHEGLDRGWYAGLVGWLDGRGEGEFAVAIRSALLRGDDALLFAGCGIMADSDPDQEYAESWLKLRPMLSALEIRHDGA